VLVSCRVCVAVIVSVKESDRVADGCTVADDVRLSDSEFEKVAVSEGDRDCDKDCDSDADGVRVHEGENDKEDVEVSD